MTTRTKRGALAGFALCALAPSATSHAVETWGAEVNLSSTPTDSESGLNHRPLAVTPDGTLHVVWAEKDGPNQNYRIYTRRLEATGWTASELVVDYLATDPGTNGGAKYPALAATPDGSLHLFWHDYRVAGINNVEIFTKALEPGGTWDSAPEADVRLTTTNHVETNGDNGYVPSPVTASDGTLHVLWYDFRFDGAHAEILSKTRAAGEEWDLSPGDSADTRVTDDEAHSELVAVDVDQTGDVHAAWRSVDSGTRVLYATRSALTGSWSTPALVDGANAVAGAPALAVDGTDHAHIVWPDGREGGRALYTRSRSPSGIWSSEQRLTPPGEAADEPSLDRGANGTLHLVWSDARISLFSRQVFHREKPPGAAWDSVGADARVSGSSGNAARPSVLAHAGGVSILWKDDRQGAEIYFRRGEADSTSTGPLASAERNALISAPNPSRGRVRLFRRDGGATGALVIFDATGRRVRALEGVGGETSWDGRTESGTRVPAGVYFAHSINTRERARVTVLR